MTYFILLLNRGDKKIKSTSFHQYSWISDVETTWISLIGWHHKTSTTYLHESRANQTYLRILGPVLPLQLQQYTVQILLVTFILLARTYFLIPFGIVASSRLKRGLGIGRQKKSFLCWLEGSSCLATSICWNTTTLLGSTVHF